MNQKKPDFVVVLLSILTLGLIIANAVDMFDRLSRDPRMVIPVVVVLLASVVAFVFIVSILMEELFDK